MCRVRKGPKRPEKGPKRPEKARLSSRLGSDPDPLTTTTTLHERNLKRALADVNYYYNYKRPLAARGNLAGGFPRVRRCPGPSSAKGQESQTGGTGGMGLDLPRGPGPPHHWLAPTSHRAAPPERPPFFCERVSQSKPNRAASRAAHDPVPRPVVSLAPDAAVSCLHTLLAPLRRELLPAPVAAVVPEHVRTFLRKLRCNKHEIA